MPHLGARAIYIIVAWFVFRKFSSDPGLTSQSFFLTYGLFVFPLIIDYWGFQPYSKRGRVVRRIGVGFGFVFLLIGLIGQTGTMEVMSSGHGYSIIHFLGIESWDMGIGYIMYPLTIYIVLSLLDWQIYSYDGTELESQKLAQKEIRRQNEMQLHHDANSKVEHRKEEYVKIKRKIIKQSSREAGGKG